MKTHQALHPVETQCRVLGVSVSGGDALLELDVHFASHHGPEGEGHGRKFTVVGILAPSGTPTEASAVCLEMPIGRGVFSKV